MKLYRDKELRGARVFFDKKPPMYMTGFLLFSLILVLGTVYSSTKIMKPYIVKAQGVISTTDLEYIPVNINGSVISIEVKSGEKVKDGDTLFTISDGLEGLESNSLVKQIEDQKELLGILDKFETSLKRKENLLNNSGKELKYYGLIQHYLEYIQIDNVEEKKNNRNLQEYEKEKGEFKAEIDNLRMQYDVLKNAAKKEQIKKEEPAKDEQNIPQAQIENENEGLEDHNLKLVEIENKIEAKTAEIEAIDEEINITKEHIEDPFSQANQVYNQLLSELGQDRTHIETSLTQLNGNLELAVGQDSIYHVKATHSGIVHYVTPIATGMSVQKNQVVAEITQNKAKDFVIEAYINAEDRSKVQVDNKVNIAVKGVNTYKYGTLSGRLIEIDPGTISHETSEGISVLYRCMISIRETELMSKKNEIIEVARSMPIEARIIYDNETYFEWLIKMLNFKG